MIYELDADEAKAVDAFRNLTAEQRKQMLETEKGGKAVRKQGEAVGWARDQWKQLVAAGLGMIGVTQAIQKGIELLKEYDEHLKKIGETSARAATGAIPLAALQAPGDVSRVLRQSAAASARMGILPEEGFNFFQRAQSVYGTYDAGAPNAIAAMRLARLTGDTASAAETIKIANQLGMTQEEFNSVLVGSAASSAADEAVFARTAPFWTQFTGEGGKPEQYFGAGITNVLSQRISNEQLPTYVQAVARTLQDVGRTDLTGVEADKMTLQERITKSMEASGRTYADLNNFERLMAMRRQVYQEYGEVTPETLAQAGITEQRERTAMATIMAPENFQRLATVLSEAPQYGSQYNLSERLQTIQEDPIIRQRMMEDVSAAQAQAMHLMGPESEAAIERAARVRAIGAESEYSWGVDEETGEAGFRRRVDDWTQRRYRTPTTGVGGQPIRPAEERPPSQEERLRQAQEETNELLQQIADNTDGAKQPERVNMRQVVE